MWYIVVLGALFYAQFIYYDGSLYNIEFISVKNTLDLGWSALA